MAPGRVLSLPGCHQMSCLLCRVGPDPAQTSPWVMAGRGGAGRRPGLPEWPRSGVISLVPFNLGSIFFLLKRNNFDNERGIHVQLLILRALSTDHVQGDTAVCGHTGAREAKHGVKRRFVI